MILAPRKPTARETLKEAAEKIGSLSERDVFAIIDMGDSREACWLLARHAQLKLRRDSRKLRREVRRWAASLTPDKLAESLLETSLLPEGVQGTSTIYVSSVDGSDADTGVTWALAKATVTGGLALLTDTTFNFLYVDSAHSASAGAAITWNLSAGLVGATVAIISVNRAGSTTTGHSGWSPGAAETTGANAALFTICSTIAQSFIIYGLTISTNNGNSASNDLVIASVTASSASVELWSCNLSIPGSATGAQYLLGGAQSVNYVKFLNCTVTTKTAAGNPAILLRGVVCDWVNTTHLYAGGTKSPTLFGFSTVGGLNHSRLNIQNSDISGFNTASGSYFDISSWSFGAIVLLNCTLSATPSLTTGAWINNSTSITIVNTDSTDTHNVFEYRTRTGTLTENTSIYRDNGAKFDGTIGIPPSGISWQIVTTSVCSEQEPFIIPTIHRWYHGHAIADRTFGLELIFDNATDLTDRTFYTTFEWLNDGSFPVGTLTSTRNAGPFDGSGVNLTASTESWTGAGGFTNSKKRVVSATFQPQERSLMRARAVIGVASWTGYIDPVLTVSGFALNPPTRWTVEGAYNEQPAGGPVYYAGASPLMMF